VTSSKTMHASDHMSAGVEYRACSSTCSRRPPAQRSPAPAGASHPAARPAARRPPRPPARPPRAALGQAACCPACCAAAAVAAYASARRKQQAAVQDQARADAQAAAAAAVQEVDQQPELASTSCPQGALLTCPRGATWRSQNHRFIPRAGFQLTAGCFHCSWKGLAGQTAQRL